jgi:hypothetical protein
MAGWTKKQLAQMHQDYIGWHKPKHPEHGIDLATFRQRLESFESVIDPWVFGEGDKSESMQKWCKDNGLKPASGRRSFGVLFQLVDAIHAIS